MIYQDANQDQIYNSNSYISPAVTERSSAHSIYEDFNVDYSSLLNSNSESKSEYTKPSDDNNGKFVSKNYNEHWQLLQKKSSELLFPASEQIFKIIQGKANLKELLDLQLQRNLLKIQYKIINRTYIKKGTNWQGGGMLVVCYTCPKKILMKYAKNQSTNFQFKLKYFDNTHLHDNLYQPSKQKVNIKKILIEQIQKFPHHTNVGDFISYFHKKHGMSTDKIRRLMYTIKSEKHYLDHLISTLRKAHCNLWIIDDIKREKLTTSPIQQWENFDPLIESPDFVMLSFPYMLEGYSIYGDICFFSVIENDIIGRKTYSYSKCWSMIAFSGLNYKNLLVPFAIAYLQIDQQTVDNIVIIIQKFFNIGKKVPRVIITPYSDTYDDIMTNLKQKNLFTGVHLYDPILYIETISKTIENVAYRKYFQNILISRTKQQYNQHMKILQKEVPPTSKVRSMLDTICKVSSKLCFSHIITKEYIGLIFRYSGNKFIANIYDYLYLKQKQERIEERLLNPANKYVKIEKNTVTIKKALYNIGRFTLRLKKPELTHVGYSMWKYEFYLNMPQMRTVRDNMQSNVIDYFMQQFGKVIELEAIERPIKDDLKKEMRIFDVYDKVTRSLFVVSPKQQFDEEEIFSHLVWKCNCLYSYKTSLPCCHQLKITIITNSSICLQIGNRWLRQRQLNQNSKSRGRRPKKTRRNTEK